MLCLVLLHDMQIEKAEGSQTEKTMSSIFSGLGQVGEVFVGGGVAAATVVDMLKGSAPPGSVVVGPSRLVRKTGGRTPFAAGDPAAWGRGAAAGLTALFGCPVVAVAG